MSDDKTLSFIEILKERMTSNENSSRSNSVIESFVKNKESNKTSILDGFAKVTEKKLDNPNTTTTKTSSTNVRKISIAEFRNRIPAEVRAKMDESMANFRQRIRNIKSR